MAEAHDEECVLVKNIQNWLLGILAAGLWIGFLVFLATVPQFGMF